MKPRAFEWLVPGLGHLLRGATGTGIRFLLVFTAWLLVVVLRRHEVRASWERGALEDWVALATLLVVPVVLAALARRTLARRLQPRSREGLGTWGLAWRTFRKKPRGVWGLTFLSLVYAVAFLCPILAPYDPSEMPDDTAGNKLLPPFSTVHVFGDTKLGEISGRAWRVEEDDLVLDRGPDFDPKRVPLSRLGVPRRGYFQRPELVRTLTIGERTVPYREDFHLFGTDEEGRDLLSRIVYGSRISLTIGFLAVGISVTLGTLVGAVTGYFGGVLDGVLMRVVDMLLSFPRLLLLLLIMAIWRGAGIFTIVAVLGATGWMGTSRLVRAEFLRLKALDFATAARALGLGRFRIMFRHLLPSAFAPVIVAATLGVGGMILVEAALSFLGWGVQPPTPSWGRIVDDGRDVLAESWWISTLPGLVIVATVVCFNLVGDALRDALDPRLAV